MPKNYNGCFYKLIFCMKGKNIFYNLLKNKWNVCKDF
ncbi:hypothetical protein NEOC95_000685 [Neochlamydia sp. AcF95]|nr:hypothetical protein [Neochlamydia sp. AcF95]